MKKEEVIRRYGEEEYKRRLAQGRAGYKAHKEEVIARVKKWQEEHPEEIIVNRRKWQEEHPEQVRAHKKKYREEHPEQVIANSQESCRKGGKYYDHKLEYLQTGLQGDRNKIRNKHANQYRPYKDIIAPDSQIHHEWIPKTDEYRGIALVEAYQHMHGIVDVIEILDGKITLLTEEEVRKGKKNEK